MRSFNVAVLLGIIVLGTPFFQTHAAGEVLIPSDNSSSSTSILPNLGLTPNSSSPSATPTIAPKPADVTTQQPYVPAPTAAAPTLSPTYKPPISASQIKLDKNGVPQMPTQIINLPGVPAVSPESPNANLPKSLNIALNNKWTPHELGVVTQKFDIAAGKVPSLCSISLSGLIRGDKSMGPFDLGSSATGIGKYDGNLMDALGMLRAYCDGSLAVPENKGVFIKMGDKYAIPLGIVHCAPPSNTSASQVSFAEDANGSMQCEIK